MVPKFSKSKEEFLEIILRIQINAAISGPLYILLIEFSEKKITKLKFLSQHDSTILNQSVKSQTNNKKDNELDKKEHTFRTEFKA